MSAAGAADRHSSSILMPSSPFTSGEMDEAAKASSPSELQSPEDHKGKVETMRGLYEKATEPKIPEKRHSFTATEIPAGAVQNKRPTFEKIEKRLSHHEGEAKTRAEGSPKSLARRLSVKSPRPSLSLGDSMSLHDGISSAPKANVTKVEPHRMAVVLTEKHGAQAFRIHPELPVRIPDTLKKRFMDSDVAKKEFHEKEIFEAFDKFENEYDCKWAELTKRADIKTLTIINRFRKIAALDPIIKRLEEKYPGLEIKNLGANDLTSDLDLSISFKDVESQHKECVVAEEFNAIFEKEIGWQHSSSKIFDTNAYTDYHLQTYHTPGVREQQQKEQTKMSLVMFYLNTRGKGGTHGTGTKIDPWEQLKKASIEKNPKKQSEFIEVENYCKQLKKLHDIKIVHVAMREQMAKPGTAGHIDEAMQKEILAGNFEDIEKSAEEIRLKLPDVVLRASNELCYEISAQQKLYHERHWDLQKLFNYKDPKTFVIQYRKAISGIIETLTTQVEELKQTLDPTVRRSVQPQLDKLNAEVKARKHDLEQSFDEKAINEFCSADNKEFTHLYEVLMTDLTLGVEADQLLLTKQEIDMQGRCFAQEMHISEGAFAFTVLDIQDKKTDLRGIGQYRQAMNEILGFYFNHQDRRDTGHEKMIEISKYIGPRMLEALIRMEKQANVVGAEGFPKFKKAAAYKNYFDENYALRKNNISSVTTTRAITALFTKYSIPIPKHENELQKLSESNQEQMTKYLIQFPTKISDNDLKEFLNYFKNSKGEVNSAQKKFLEKQIAVAQTVNGEPQIPRDSNDEPDVTLINQDFLEIMVEINQWCDKLEPEKLFESPASHVAVSSAKS